MNEEFALALNAKLSARGRQVKESGGNVAVLFTRKQIEQAFIESFELIGGVPRLAQWAAEQDNYADFLQLLVKFAPRDTGKEAGGSTIEYRSNVPPSPLNRASPAQEIISEGQFVEVGYAGAKD